MTKATNAGEAEMLRAILQEYRERMDTYRAEIVLLRQVLEKQSLETATTFQSQAPVANEASPQLVHG
jgi:hypothetical protein